jgi:hypothetical protein
MEIRITTFVSSFSKSAPTPQIEKEYGDNYFGFKNDRIGALISPVHKCGPLRCLFWDNVHCYDIIYGINEAKNELNYLFDTIDIFPVNDDQKNAFVNHIMTYWIYSFKDKKWEYECERRYEMSLSFDDYDYYDVTIGDKFLKMQTTLFLYPDFVSINNIGKERIRENRVKKLMAIGTKPIIFCNECLNSKVQVQVNKKESSICAICGSESTVIIPFLES